jgi:hypothetical protein
MKLIIIKIIIIIMIGLMGWIIYMYLCLYLWDE